MKSPMPPLILALIPLSKTSLLKEGRKAIQTLRHYQVSLFLSCPILGPHFFEPSFPFKLSSKSLIVNQKTRKRIMILRKKYSKRSLSPLSLFF